jgi:putative addiction module component (TIGR02574 family)
MAQITTAELHDLALNLNAEDRAKLATALIDSLGPGPLEKDEGYDEAWTAEILRRSDAIHEGRETTQSAEEFEAEMRGYLVELRSERATNQGDS